MSFNIRCECGKQFKVKDENAGKKAKCPGCGRVLVLNRPAAAPPSSAPELDGLAAMAEMERNAVVEENAPVEAPRRQAAGPQYARIACPHCGTMIPAQALICEACRNPIRGGALPNRRATSYAVDTADSDLTAGEWVLAIICSGIGCIMGIIWMVQGKPKGWKMLAVSLTAAAIGNTIGFILGYASMNTAHH
jgi:DNA-directed RNA polymerase subunit RPC12/RpoP